MLPLTGAWIENKRRMRGAKGGKKDYRHEAVELSGLDHLPKPELLFVDGALAGFARRSRRFCIFHLPWLRRVRHSPTLSLSLSSLFFFHGILDLLVTSY